MAERRIEQTPIAHSLGMSQANFSRRVNGHTRFTINEIEILAPLLGVREEYLYGFTDERSPRLDDQNEGFEVVRHEGLEPPTR